MCCLCSASADGTIGRREHGIASTVGMQVIGCWDHRELCKHRSEPGPRLSHPDLVLVDVGFLVFVRAIDGLGGKTVQEPE